MKRRFLLLLLTLALLTDCGKTDGAAKKEVASEVYSQEEIDEAIEAAERYFQEHFKGCTLTEIWYVGDEKTAGFQEFADRNGAEQVIVLLSNFEVDASGGDGSLNPNSTYTDWNWILVRDGSGPWRHVDHGY